MIKTYYILQRVF